jgi:RNA 3'-terminal phosphate cyclase (ATP)
MPQKISEPLVINASQGEGGGALFRTAIAMSCLSQLPVRMHHIRGATRKPGITCEDLTFLEIMRQSVKAHVEGDDLDSEEMIFVPTRTPRPVSETYDIGRWSQGNIPGNALMVFQSTLPVLARAGGISMFRVIGETFNPNTLTFDAFQNATLGLHAKQGLVAFAGLEKAGFGFANRGEVAVEVEPSVLTGFDWREKGKLLNVTAVLTYNGVGKDVPNRAEQGLYSLIGPLTENIDVILSEVNARSTGLFLTIVGTYEQGKTAVGVMGERNMRMEHLIKNGVNQLVEFHKSPATLDAHLADQVLVAAALSGQNTRFKTNMITQRLQTMVSTIKQFMPISITVIGRTNEPGEVSISY